MTMALILAVTRRLVEGDADVRRTGRCEWDPLKLLGPALQGRQLGIIGMGRIGTAVANRARAFGMEIVHHSRTSGVPLDVLLATSDVVTLHAPLTPETRHVVNRHSLARMKRGAFLINTSRGPLVDEEALCDALDAGHLRGAGLDVYENEPAVNPRLLPMSNVVILPHIGSATEETRSGMARIAATEVLRFFRGQPPLHSVV
jgi:glyoxylate reductase